MFDCRLGLEHVPTFDESRPLTHACAVVLYRDGGHNFVVLTRSNIERLRMRSPQQRGAPTSAWTTDYEAKAKALKQMAKYIPLTIDQATALATDGAVMQAGKLCGRRGQG